jgi:hypothetical protein
VLDPLADFPMLPVPDASEDTFETTSRRDIDLSQSTLPPKAPEPATDTKSSSAKDRCDLTPGEPTSDASAAGDSSEIVLRAPSDASGTASNVARIPMTSATETFAASELLSSNDFFEHCDDFFSLPSSEGEPKTIREGNLSPSGVNSRC